MAVTIGVTDLAAAVRIGDGTEEPPEPQRSIMRRLLAVCAARAERYAPNAPDVVHDEAVIRMGGYLYDAPTSAPGSTWAHAFYNSGAAGLLTPWKVRRITWIDDDDAEEAMMPVRGFTEVLHDDELISPVFRMNAGPQYLMLTEVESGGGFTGGWRLEVSDPGSTTWLPIPYDDRHQSATTSNVVRQFDAVAGVTYRIIAPRIGARAFVTGVVP